jgi:cytochrome c553
MKSIIALTAALVITASAATAADAPENWGKLCAACHGKDGVGNTKAGKKKDIKDLTSADYQKTFTDDDAFKALKGGMTGKDGSSKMNSFSDKLSDDDIKVLVTYVRTLAK